MDRKEKGKEISKNSIHTYSYTEERGKKHVENDTPKKLKKEQEENKLSKTRETRYSVCTWHVLSTNSGRDKHMEGRRKQTLIVSEQLEKSFCLLQLLPKQW